MSKQDKCQSDPSPWWRIFFGFFLFSLAFQSGERPVNDGYSAFVVAEGIVDDGSWVYYPGYSPGYSVVGPDGKAYSKFGLGMSAFLIPVAWCNKILSLGVEDPTRSQVLQTLVQRTPLAFIASLSALLLILLLYRAMNVSLKHAFLLTFIAILCTPAWVYFRVFYSEGLLTCAVIGTVAFAALARKNNSVPLMIGVGVMSSLGLLAKPAGILLFPLGLYLLFRGEDGLKGTVRRVFCMMSGALPGLVLAFSYNWVRTGEILGSTYTEGIDQFGFSTPLHEGLFGLLFSFGKGVLFYGPVALLGTIGWIRKGKNQIGFGILTLSFALLMVSASWWAWHGGECWGPRLIVPVLPLLAVGIVFLPMSSRLIRGFLLLTIIWGGGISVLGTSVHWQAHYERVSYTSWAEAMASAPANSDKEVLGRNNLEHVHNSWTQSGIPAHLWLFRAAIFKDEFGVPWGESEPDASPYGLNYWVIWPKGNTSKFSFLIALLFVIGGFVLTREGVRALSGKT